MNCVHCGQPLLEESMVKVGENHFHWECVWEVGNNWKKRTQVKSRKEFSVYQFFPDESCERVVQFVSDGNAVKVAYQCCNSVGAKIGTTQRVIITDGGDYICFEWIFGKGITYPPELVRKSPV